MSSGNRPQRPSPSVKPPPNSEEMKRREREKRRRSSWGDVALGEWRSQQDERRCFWHRLNRTVSTGTSSDSSGSSVDPSGSFWTQPMVLSSHNSLNYSRVPSED